MSQRSEVYQELRKQLKALGQVKGKKSTKSMMSHLDSLWGAMVRTRAAMVKTLMIRGSIDSPKDVDPRDFLSLYLQIHNPKRESRLCEHCCGRVEFGVTVCPYCGEKVNGHNSQDFLSGVTIDFDVQSQAPDWDVDTDPTEILNKNKPDPDDIEGLEYIKPITQRDDIHGPTGVPKKRTKHRDTTARSTRNLIAWVKKRELYKHVPYTHTQLRKMNYSDLMLMVSIYKEFSEMSWMKLSSQTNEELIQFVLGHQGKKVDLSEPPVGKLPDLDDVLEDEDE